MAIDPTLAFATIVYDWRINTTISKPTGVVDGDTLLAGLYIEYSAAVTPPAGWTLIARLTHASGFSIDVYYKRASSEGTSWTWTHAEDATAGFVKRITGVIATGDPEDCARSTRTATDSAAVWNSITTVTDGALLCGIASHYNQATISGTTLTERIDAAVILVADVQATAGASGNKTGTWSAFGNHAEMLIALTPEGAAPSAVFIPKRRKKYLLRR